ncbi:MAG TPA: parallel beta-helix domain-containing protein, partial [Blastocatellia bacterium]|nr:parallel beta-helix domain-containing protein [Blastocatellia bacterium]
MAAAPAKQIDQDQPHSEPRPRSRRLGLRIVLGLLAVLFAAFIAMGLWPVQADFVGDVETAGVSKGGGGLVRQFPKMVLRADNPLASAIDDQRVQLGRLLFFDPILSGANDISCATCHHPDLGFSDARGLSMGKGGHGIGAERAGGALVRRGAPTIWNAAYNHKQFWDGRAEDLEEQANGPITSDIEMNENPETLVKELKGIPEYAQRFDAAFAGRDGSAVSLENVQKAVAAFERTLTANNSPFDRFVRGELGALTPEQRRGFNLFRSGRTRCFECHGAPTFANRDFKIIGVPEVDGSQQDYGRFEVTKGEGNKYAFKVPTLRNIVLNAPYMHNGKFKTLEEVLDFYAAGGGPGVGFKEPKVDDKIHSYQITAEEKKDLIAFLFALTDESNLPEFPDKVPSGLAVVPRLLNPVRDLVAKFNTGSSKEEIAERPPQKISVNVGESIQAAVDRARPGDTIEVMPGVYNEEVKIDLDNITLRGIAAINPPSALSQANQSLAHQHPPTRPVLDGDKKLGDAVLTTGSNFLIENFDIQHYVGNGVVAQHARNVTFRNLKIDDTGLYGVYPVSCTGVMIERCVATGIADAALYVGQSRDIVVRDSEAYNNVTGIEIENSVNAVVENNNVHDNTGGILVFILPNNPSKAGHNCIVRNNRVINNNHVNFANPNSIVANVPPGTGVMVMAADNTEVTGNEVRGNDCYGVAVFSL